MPSKRSDFKQQIRDEAKRVVGGSRFQAVGHKQYREAVEQGRRNLLVSCNQSGDSAAKKYKNELMYLLNNYLPKYDTRIEQLIDAWRTSGDPSYDVGIRSRLRQVQREFSQKSNPL